MKIGFFDHGLINQSAAIPGLPDEYPFAITPGLKHTRVNVIGCEMWRIPLLHKLIDDGHQIVWLSRRDIMPSEDMDYDLVRLAEMEPQFEPFVRERDPMLDRIQWDCRSRMSPAYVDGYMAMTEEERKARGWNNTNDLFNEWFQERKFGEPPEADVVVMAAMRANVITAFEQGYTALCYIARGTPVVWWDQDRQLAGVKNMFEKAGFGWPHPLATVIGPWEGEAYGEKVQLIDYPYVSKFELPYEGLGTKNGIVYVGNDYDRRQHMERLLLHLPETAGMEVRVYGKYDNDDSKAWIAKHPQVRWMGRIPSCHVPEVVAEGKLTVNVVKHNYMKIGLITLRTFDSSAYGTLQIGDARVKRMADWVDPVLLADNEADATRIAREIDALDDAGYGYILEQQRKISRGNDLNTVFMPRFYELLDNAIKRGRES